MRLLSQLLQAARLPPLHLRATSSGVIVRHQHTRHTMSSPQVTILSREQDPQAAEEAAKTIALAMSEAENNLLFVTDPKHYYDDWWATVLNYQLRMPTQPFIHALPGNTCVSYAYWFPDQKPVFGEGQGPIPPGGIDGSSWERHEGVPVFESLLQFLTEGRDQFLQEHGPFLYIAFMSAHPDHQGKGHGSTMLKHLTGLADREGKWAYLESSNASNQRLYERFGFRLLGRDKRFELPELAPGVHLTLRTMGRPPQPTTETNQV